MTKAKRPAAKAALRGLAVLGARPAFKNSLHVGRPNIGNRQRFLDRLNDVLDRRWLTNGGCYVGEFERRLEEFLGVKHCVATCNGTVALEIAIKALGMTGEVIVPSFTFVATVHALQWRQITPVFCDIDPRTHTLAPGKVEDAITPRTTGIIGVHVWGRACAIDELEEIAHRRRLKLLFDSAAALGCSYKGRLIGSFGNAEILSFHATKFVNSGEGGAVVTNDEDLATRLRLMKNFGFAGADKVISIGTNGKMSELAGALGLTNLESIERFTRINRGNFDLYCDELSTVPGISVFRCDDNGTSHYQYVVIEVDAAKTRLTRDQLLAVLQAENVLARRYFYPGVHRMEPYRSCFPDAGLSLPATEAVADRVLVLPTGTAVTHKDIRKICAILRFAIGNRREISAAMAR
jgi:dTDP-4-amino-4,6-dideoxygalactose transaminase